ncbi:MAG: 2'-5' RNA ligase family protein [Microgenomates group bacterium]
MNQAVYEIDITPPKIVADQIADATHYALGSLPDNFRPHITIKEPFSLNEGVTLSEFSTILRSKIGSFRTFTINLPNINFFDHLYSPIRHKTLYLEVVKSDELLNLHRTITSLANSMSSDVYGSHALHEKDFTPHLSLEWDITNNFDKLFEKFESKKLSFIFDVEAIGLFEEVDPDLVIFKQVHSFPLKNE